MPNMVYILKLVGFNKTRSSLLVDGGRKVFHKTFWSWKDHSWQYPGADQRAMS